MMKNDKKALIIISLVFFAYSVIFFGKTGNILIDFSRESYIPYQMNHGCALIKDIFLIYGFWGYFINSIIYKFAVNINILIFEAHLISYAICILFYFILKKYTDTFNSILFGIFFITVSVFSDSTFSFVMPYSYSTLWGVLGIFLVLFSVLYKKNYLVYLSLGFIFINRIEFFIPALITILIYEIKNKNFSVKYFGCILIFPIFALLKLIIDKIDIHYILNNLVLIKSMILSQSLNYLYKAMGVTFGREFFIYNLKNLAIYLILSIILYKLFKYNKYIVLFVATALYCLLCSGESLNLLFFVNFCLLIYTILKRKIQTNEILLYIFTLILASKGLYAINPYSYSNFSYCLCFFFMYLMLEKYLNKKTLIYLIMANVIALNISSINYCIKNKKYPYKTDIGKIYLKSDDIELFKNTDDFIKKNIKQNEQILVLPEGQIFNLINKKDWGFYNSTFTPLDFETFKEENLIKKLKNNKTDYLIFYPRNTVEYGKNPICYEYGVDFCTYVMDNYSRIKMFENGKKVLIFKIRN